MVYKGYSRRFKRYSSKFDPDTVRARFEQVKDVAIEQVQEAFARLVDLEESVKARLNELGVSVIFMPHYLNVAREIWRKMNTHSGKTLEMEVKAIKAKWTTRGLDPSIIDEVITITLGYVPTY